LNIKPTQYYNINIGLLEGSKLSPVLYAFFANSLLTRLQTRFPDITTTPIPPNIDVLHDTPVWHAAIMYADDLALIAHTRTTPTPH
jgi:hypothetical protein